MTEIKQIVEKANILTEALPYIRDFTGKIMVIKLGRSALAKKELLLSAIDDIALLKLIGAKIVLVHSGSDEINRWLKINNKEIAFIDDNRVTDSESAEIIEMVLGKINKNIVSQFNARSVKAVGISGKDAETVKCIKKTVSGGDLGFFGKIINVDTSLITELLNDGFTPVVATIGADEKGQTYNLKADELTGEIAKALNAEKVVYLTQGNGISENDGVDLKAMLKVSDVEKMLESSVLPNSTLKKLAYATDAVKGGVRRAHIINGATEHGILLELFTIYGIGTAIVDDNEKLYNHEKMFRKL